MIGRYLKHLLFQNDSWEMTNIVEQRGDTICKRMFFSGTIDKTKKRLFIGNKFSKQLHDIFW